VVDLRSVTSDSGWSTIKADNVFEPCVEQFSYRGLCSIEGPGFNLRDESSKSLGGLTSRR
jgi:hypothetical protein